MNPEYNGHTVISYFQCRNTYVEVVFTYVTKGESTSVFHEFVNLVEGAWKYKIFYMCRDGESSLGNHYS